MKIAFIINSLNGGGAERVVQTLSNYLIDQNHKLYIILLNKEKHVYNIDHRIKIITLKTSILSKGIGKVLFIPIQSLELFFLLKKYELNNSISFLVRANLIFALTKMFSNHRVIISERSLSQKHYGKKNISDTIMRFLIKSFYKRSDRIIAISNGVKKSLIESFNLRKNKIEVIYNPLDINYIKQYNLSNIEYVFNKDIQYFISIGRLIELKDHKTLINSFKIVHMQNKNTKLLILGDGPLKDVIRNQIDFLNLNDAVILLGFVDNPFEFLKRSDVFVLSSKFEGFGNVLVEAMACGLPIISTNCPTGPAEILDFGKYGMLTPVGDTNSLSISMSKMLSEAVRRDYSLKSLKRVKSFDVSIIAKHYINVLHNKN